MLPLLAKWMLMWMSLLKKAIKGVSDDLIVKYLITPRKLNQAFNSTCLFVAQLTVIHPGNYSRRINRRRVNETT